MTFQVTQQILAFVPNKILHTTYGDAVKLPNGKLWYSSHKPYRTKRVAPVIMLAVANAIGGLVLKGIDSYSNYKQNNAMDNAVKVLIENDRRFHERMIRMEENIGVIVRTTATGFEQINEGFNKLNRSVQVGFYRIDDMLNQTEQKFREMHDTLNNHHLVIHYLSKSVGVVLPLIRKYRSTLQKYRLAIKGFINGSDEMSTGRLCYEILDPIQFSKYLRTIEKNLTDSHSNYTLVFQHTYQYYAKPMVSFSNSPNFLIIQVPIFLRYKFQLLMSLFSTDVVLIPYDTETYLGHRKQFTEIKLRMGYFTVSNSQYIELTEEQLRMCWKLRGVYYCEQAYLMISKEIKSCEAAIYFEMSEEVKITNCDFRYMQNKEYPPKILDTGDQFVLSNLLQPWILMCKKSQRPFAIPYSTYHIINHTELCECSLTAAYEYQINKATLQCSLDDQPFDHFVTYFAHNQAILDVLKYSHDIDVSNQLGR